MRVKQAAVFLLLVLLTGLYRAATGVRFSDTLSGFSDAPISAHLKSRAAGQLDAIQVPMPETPRRPEETLAGGGADPDGRPFITADLISAAIAGGTPQETRENVELFFGRLGLRIIAYRDNDACGEALLEFSRPAGMEGAVRLASEKREALKAARELGEIAEVSGSSYRVIFSGRLYPARIREIFSVFPDLAVTLPGTGAAPGGFIRVQLSANDMANLEAAAAKLKKRFPSTIFSAAVTTGVAPPAAK